MAKLQARRFAWLRPGFGAKRILDDCITRNILLGVGLFVLFKILIRKKIVANCLVDRLENFGSLFKSKPIVLDADSNAESFCPTMSFSANLADCVRARTSTAVI